MIVLDEQLMRRRIAAEIAHWYKGRVTNILALRPATVVKDDSIASLLLQVPQSTFVTINVNDFWRKIPPHPRYCVIGFDIPQTDALELPTQLRALLRRPELATKAQRMGKVVRVSGRRIRYYGRDRHIVTL